MEKGIITKKSMHQMIIARVNNGFVVETKDQDGPVETIYNRTLVTTKKSEVIRWMKDFFRNDK